MPVVDISHINKSFADKRVVDDVSFAVSEGEIFGLIGPNGAGKTTTIRMMMDIIKPDSGEIRIMGEPLCEESKDRLGYLPEERGLYKRMTVMDSIIYLASLKGMAPEAARARADELLTLTGMTAARGKKIEELSKGMGQIIQVIVTIVHDPELIVLDEPFSALDPVNTELLKNLLADLRKRGKAIILSTHQMNQVEELCDRILMIDGGKAVLYGNLREIKSRFRSRTILLDAEGNTGTLAGVAETHENNGTIELVLDKEATPLQVLSQLVERKVAVNRFEVSTPSLNEIFLEVVGHHE